MQQDHVESKADEKSGRAPARAKTSPDLPSQARAVLNLQNTAGNRAMARILTPPAKAAPLQRAALSPVPVQRDELMDAIRTAYGESEVLPLEKLARMIVGSLRASDREPVEEPERTSVTEKPKKEESDLTETQTVNTKKFEAPEASLSKDELAKKRADLEEKEKAFRERPSGLDDESDELRLREQRLKLDQQERALGRKRLPEENQLLVRDVRLAALKSEQTEAEKLSKEEAELSRPKTEGEKANQARRAKLDEVKKRKEAGEEREKKRKQVEELKRKLSGQMTPEEKADQELEDQLADLKKQQDEAAKMRQFERQRKPLNPQGQSLTQILGGRRF